jgi:hypothetical protein
MTAFIISNLPAPAGSLQYAELFAPGGGLIAAEMPLVESPAGIFGGTVAIDPGSVDNLTTPYEYEVRQVLTPDPAGFDASATITVSRGTYGYLSGGVWYGEPPLGSAVGFWETQAQVEQKFGVTSTGLDVDLNNTGAGTAAVWQQALDWVDALVDRIFGQAGYSRPTDLTSTDYVLASGYAASIVRNELHKARGWTELTGQPTGQGAGGVFQKEADEAEAKLRSMAVRGVSFAKVSTEANVGPSSIAPSYDRFGYPVRTSANSWPVMPWGYGWGYGGW